MPGSALDLLSGDAQTFLTKVWASRSHLHRADPGQFVDLFGLDDADRLLTASAIRTPSIRVVKDGVVQPEAGYTRGATLAGKALSGLVDARKVLALFDDGATIVFQGLHRYWPPITRLIAELELELGHPCQANAYLTPPGARGFSVHSDSHDVFVVQTVGSKRWEVHGTDDVEELELVAGMSMYLPTGTPHAARSQDEVSLHVTIGINQVTWRSLVQRTVAAAIAHVGDEHLPAGYLDEPGELAEGLAHRLTDVASRLRDLDPMTAVEDEVQRFLTSRNSRLGGGLHDVLAVGALDDRTRLRRRPGHPCVLLTRGDRVTALLGDRALDLPAWLRPALERVRDAGEFAPADLDECLDPQSRLVLCRRLVREGLLEVLS